MNSLPTTRRQRSQHGVIAAETIGKTIVNSIISVAAVAAIARFYYLHQHQQAKLREVQVEVQETTSRVNQLSNELSRNFETYHLPTAMQQYSPRLAAEHYQIILDSNSQSQ